jgi:hypothetical protein
VCWHKWSNWIDGTANLTSSILQKSGQDVLIQFRRCSKCKKLRTRYV